jgi:hypothetical protein
MFDCDISSLVLFYVPVEAGQLVQEILHESLGPAGCFSGFTHGESHKTRGPHSPEKQGDMANIRVKQKALHNAFTQ